MENDQRKGLTLYKTQMLCTLGKVVHIKAQIFYWVAFLEICS